MVFIKTSPSKFSYTPATPLRFYLLKRQNQFQILKKNNFVNPFWLYIIYRFYQVISFREIFGMLLLTYNYNMLLF